MQHRVKLHLYNTLLCNTSLIIKTLLINQKLLIIYRILNTMLKMESVTHISPILFLSIRVIVFLIGLNFLYQVIIRVCRDFREFAKLPRMPIIGSVGWLLGNLDLYYYTMRHLGVEEGKLSWLFSNLIIANMLKTVSFL